MTGRQSLASTSRQHDLKDGRRRALVSLIVAELDPEQRLIEALAVSWFDSVLFIVSNELLCFFRQG